MAAAPAATTSVAAALRPRTRQHQLTASSFTPTVALPGARRAAAVAAAPRLAVSAAAAGPSTPAQTAGARRLPLARIVHHTMPAPNNGPPTPYAVGAAVVLGAAALALLGRMANSKKSGRSRPMRVIIAGAPASGKGTQCETIAKDFGLVHVSAGDLLRAEVAAGSEYGKKAQAFMDAGKLVPDEVVVTMVKARLSQADCQTHGWLLDGYPRSQSQAEALEAAGITPDIFLLLEVPDEMLIDRVVGRRQDPVTGKIYHLTYSPPESAEVRARLTQRSDDTEEKAKTRLGVHHANVAAVEGKYRKILQRIDGNRDRKEVYATIAGLLNNVAN